MGEARSMAVPVTRGCSYNACLYCALNKYPFQAFSLEQIAENIDKLAFIHSRDRKPLRRAVLLQGNPFVLSTDKLLAIADLLRRALPDLREITSFARADDVLRKTDAELQALRAAGYVHLTLGVESGSDAVLALQHKGVSRTEQKSAMQRLDAADIAYDCYLMLGLGGRDLSQEHIRETASLMNQVHPHMLILVTTVLFPDAELVHLLKAGSFRRLSPRESMEEMALLIRLLDGPLLFNATHKTNLFALKGRLPQQREDLLAKLEVALDEHRANGQGLRENQRWQRFGTE